ACRALPDHAAGGLQAPEGAGGRRCGEPAAGAAAPAGTAGRGGLRPDGQVDRALPAPGGGALPPPRRGAGADERPGARRYRRAEGKCGVNTIAETTIEADPKVPVIRMSRDFNATAEQLFRAHTDPELFAQW